MHNAVITEIGIPTLLRRLGIGVPALFLSKDIADATYQALLAAMFDSQPARKD